jgi:hypothetical protein
MCCAAILKLTIMPGLSRISLGILFAPVAQGTEQRFPKPRVVGSSPTGGAWVMPVMCGGRPRFWVTLIILFLLLIPAGMGQWDVVIAIFIGLVVGNGLAFLRER